MKGPILYLLLTTTLFTSSCKAQVSNDSSRVAHSLKPAPKIIGTPPPLVMNATPTNDNGLVAQYIRSIFQDSKGNYWFGPAGQSVVKYDGETLNYISKNEFFGGEVNSEINFISVHAINEDKNGNVWFGTDQGVIKYDGKKFKRYHEVHGLSCIGVSRHSIMVDHDGNIWVGTIKGVYRYDAKSDMSGLKCFSRFDLVPEIFIKYILEDKDKNVWMATEEHGIFKYDGQTITNITDRKLGYNYTEGMAEDKFGNIWFTIENGICKYDGKTFTEITNKDGLGGTEFWGLIIEDSGIIWVTARGSTTRFDPSLGISDPKAFTVFTPEDGLNCCVQSMYQDRSGNMWWGAGQGLYRFDGKKFYQVKQEGPW